MDGTRWTCLLASYFLAAFAYADVVIQEIHYNPAERGLALEFVELINTGPKPVDLSGWRFEDGIEFTFPDKTVLKSGSLLVVAENPAVLRDRYGIEALGPWVGKLSNQGETLALRDRFRRKVDEVDYRTGFPWPTLAAGGGASMELIHPGLDNDLAGSWRSSIQATNIPAEAPQVFLAAQDREWVFHKGRRPPSRPAHAWRGLRFNHRSWTKGQTPIGYGDRDDNTVLTDMLSNYTTVYLRHTFEVDPKHSLDRPVVLRIYSDDGAVAWINGKEVARLRVPRGELTHRSRTTRNHEAAWEEVVLDQPQRWLRTGWNILAIVGVNGGLDSSDFSIDAELAEMNTAAIPPSPSPGEPNRSAVANPPPQIRQVAHEPLMAKTNDEVTISAKVTDPNGVARVTLHYQRLIPGDYIARNDRRFETAWTEVAMIGKDNIYTSTIPASMQQHRHLMRYRIIAEDKLGAMVRVPYADDAQSNFAYYCYDGAPAWTGADRPGRTAPKTFRVETMNGLPAIHLIAHTKDVENSQYHYAYNEQFLTGTLVVNSTVYDHIRFRNRGETTTYMVGKNKWRINFNRTRELPAHVLDGGSKARRWKRLNLNPGTVPYHAGFRGNAALNERLAFRLYQLSGIPAPDTAYAQFRVIDDASEAGRDQYSGDLWGLYMAFEAIDGFMLDNHDLPDSELHRIAQGGNSVERLPAMPAPPELDFRNFWSKVRRYQTADWWQRTVDLERYYTFHAISIVSGRIDQKLNHNHFLYRHPERGWHPLPWDADLCLRPAIYDPSHLRWHPYLKNCLEIEPFWIDYQNRGRALIDLLFKKDQIYPLVDQLVKDLGPIDEEASFAELDRFLWNYHPKTSGGHRGTFYRQRVHPHEFSTEIRFETQSFAERVQYFKDYLTAANPQEARQRGKHYKGWGYRQLRNDTADPDIPQTPIITRIGKDSSLRFKCSYYADPQGTDTFAGMRWRIGEVGDDHYEVEPVWESSLLTTYHREFTFPSLPLAPGHTYRVRSRFRDDSGRESHWSAPVQFVVAEPDVSAYQAGLVISEIMYHPAKDGTEFIELMNIGKRSLDLRPLRFTQGIEFDFQRAKIQTLAAGARILVVSDEPGFTKAHPNSTDAVAGSWGSGKLANGGERLVLGYGSGKPLIRLRYDDTAPWPETADGGGHSLELKTPANRPDPNNAMSWQASKEQGGSPGT